MKKIFLLLALACATTFVSAQNISFIYHDEPMADGDTVTVYAYPGAFMDAVHFNLRNNSRGDITGARVQSSLTDTTDTDIELVSVCFGSCLEGTLSPEFTLAGNTTSTDILFFDFNVAENATLNQAHIVKLTTGTNSTYDNCGTIYVKIIVHSTGIDGARNNVVVKTFPNPAGEVVNIAAEESIRSVRVVNTLGQVVYTNNNVNAESLQLNVRDYATGMYIMTIQTTKGITTQRFQKM